jgi:hypothetical protein
VKKIQGKWCCERDSNHVPPITLKTRVSAWARYLGRTWERLCNYWKLSIFLTDMIDRYDLGFPTPRHQSRRKLSSLFRCRHEHGTPSPKLHLTPQIIPQSAHPFSTSWRVPLLRAAFCKVTWYEMVAMVTTGCARADFWGSSAEYMERSRGDFRIGYSWIWLR